MIESSELPACGVASLGPSSDLVDGARLFKALADPTRLAILRQLRACGDVCACDFSACCAVAQPTVSHHLRILREAGLISGQKRGLWIHYRLNPDAVARVSSLIP
jgi:ArsR family transcriptional regulator